MIGKWVNKKEGLPVLDEQPFFQPSLSQPFHASPRRDPHCHSMPSQAGPIHAKRLYFKGSCFSSRYRSNAQQTSALNDRRWSAANAFRSLSKSIGRTKLIRFLSCGTIVNTLYLNSKLITRGYLANNVL